MSQKNLDDVSKIIDVVGKLVSVLKNLFGACTSLPKDDDEKTKKK